MLSYRKGNLIILIALSFISGICIAMYRVTHWTGADAVIKNGAWMGQNLNDVGDDRLLTARIAVAALFALRSEEVIYLVANADDEGKPLDAQHEYVIKGTPMDARYWSITLYGEDYFLVPNEANRFSFNMMNLHYEKDSSFVIKISADADDGNWLPAGEKGNFYLALRLYHPQKDLVENIETVKLPVIQRVK